jgi:2'-5' RNA ligase
MRLFTGIPVGNDFAESALNLRSMNASNKGIRWVPAENLHLTTCFIGEASRADLDRFLELTEQSFANHELGSLKLEKICLWPARNPYMVWALYEDQAGFAKFYRSLEKTLLGSAGQGPVKAHVTLARFKEFSEYRKLNLEQVQFPLQLELTRLNFYESVLKPEGPDYRIIRSFDL